MGRKKKYHTEAERKAAKNQYAKNAREKKTGKKGRAPISWLKTIEGKLESAVESTTVTKDAELPTPKEGNPFEGLPTLDLPASTPTDGGQKTETESTEAGNTDGQPSTPPNSTGESTADASSAKPGKGVVIDVSEIEAMLGPFVEQGVRMAGVYASERGFFALGDPFPRLAREAACIIIRKRAQDIGMDEEEYAAWLLGGVVGVNGIQAFRAFKAEQKTKAEEAKKAAPHVRPQPVAEPGAPGAREAVNGTHSAPPAPQPAGDAHTLRLGTGLV